MIDMLIIAVKFCSGSKTGQLQTALWWAYAKIAMGAEKVSDWYLRSSYDLLIEAHWKIQIYPT